MRIQHNIMAMGAYRNYTNNLSAMQKNLEKLSSGYKINRAGDDAAGLAISEKMRAQITGLETAQKNAKDGISLVQTAEGALTEVHDMLNRMVELATQSANGTYDNETDRAQLQKEMDQLRDEINRIADSSNFNGIKLLDGSMASKATEIAALASSTPLDGSLVNGTNPTAAGAAEITVKLEDATAEGAKDLTVNEKKDGQSVSAATPAEYTIKMGGLKLDSASVTGTINNTAGSPITVSDFTSLDFTNWESGDSISVTVGGKTYTYAHAADCANANQLKSKMEADGLTLTANATDGSKYDIVAVDAEISGFKNSGTLEAGATVADLKDLQLATGSQKIGDYFDVYLDGSSTAAANGDAISNGTVIKLVAKVSGDLGADVKKDLSFGGSNSLSSTGITTGAAAASSEVKDGVDEGTTAATSEKTKYEMTFDMENVRGGQYIQIDDKKFIINAGADETDDATNKLYYINIGQLSDTAGDGLEDEIADAIKNEFNAVLGSDFDIEDDFDASAGTFKLTLTGKGTIANTNAGEGRVSVSDPDAIKVDYTPAGPATSSTSADPFASITYQDNSLKAASMVEGTKITIGDKTIEIVANGKKTKAGQVELGSGQTALAADAASQKALAAALEEMKFSGGKVAFDLTNGKITITGTEAGGTAQDLVDTIGKVSVYDKANAAAAATVAANSNAGFAITAGLTTVGTLKGATVFSDGTNNKNVGDVFTITVNGQEQNDSYVIQEGDEIKFTAKVNGELEKSIIDKFNYTSGVTDLIAKNGWDEGSSASGDKTHYELQFNMGKLAGGQTFTFGNESGKSKTFELSYDSKTTDNGTVVADEKYQDLANSQKVIINLFGLSEKDAAKKIKDTVSKAMGDFSVSSSLSNGTLTIKMDANKEGAEYNFGEVRVSTENKAMSGAVYKPAGGGAGGVKGTYAHVSYNFDVDALQSGDTLTVGGTTIHFGDSAKTEMGDDGKVKITVSLEDAKKNPNSAISKALESAGYTDGQVSFDTAKKTMTITDARNTGGDAAAFAKSDAKVSMGSTTRNLKATTGGLTLQIGDTADDFNQLKVSIKDCHTESLGIGDISIADQESAQSAVDAIRSAINYVSDVRGTLGATQNRLDHTINNLSVMTENIQDAESTIRDTDIAEEMMAYTKNNILIQSAQAMLAQANQVPQGVLQLLQ